MRETSARCSAACTLLVRAKKHRRRASQNVGRRLYFQENVPRIMCGAIMSGAVTRIRGAPHLLQLVLQPRRVEDLLAANTISNHFQSFHYSHSNDQLGTIQHTQRASMRKSGGVSAYKSITHT